MSCAIFRLPARSSNYLCDGPLSPHVFVSKERHLPRECYIDTIGKNTFVDNMVYVVPQVSRDLTSYRCSRKSSFVETQLFPDGEQELTIHVQAMKCTLFQDSGLFSEGARGEYALCLCMSS
jgi:hypothetical protein